MTTEFLSRPIFVDLAHRVREKQSLERQQLIESEARRAAKEKLEKAEIEKTLVSIKEVEERVLARLRAIPLEERLRREREYEEKQRQEKENRISELLSLARIPSRHAQNRATLKREGMWLRALEYIVTGLRKGGLWALVGPWGRGKTQLAVEVIFYVCNKHKRARYTTAEDMFRDIRTAYSANSKRTEDQAIAVYRNVDLLVIDESHRRRESQWEDNTLTSLVDYRYRESKNTILISNLEKAAFDLAMGNAIVDRINEAGGFIRCEWGSFREIH